MSDEDFYLAALPNVYEYLQYHVVTKSELAVEYARSFIRLLDGAKTLGFEWRHS